MNPYLKYVSSHFLTLAIELYLVHFGGSASFTFELQYVARHYHPVHTLAVVTISLYITKYAICLIWLD